MRDRCTFLVLLLLLLAGCGPETVVTTRIGPDGGTIEAGGVTVRIPAGALGEDVDISVEVITDLEAAGYAAAPGGLDGAPAISVALTPHGTTFTAPITLTLPYTGPTAELILVRLDDAEDTSWDTTGPLIFGDGTVSVQISQFSVYSLAAAAAGSCPCWSGAVIAEWRSIVDAEPRLTKGSLHRPNVASFYWATHNVSVPANPLPIRWTGFIHNESVPFCDAGVELWIGGVDSDFSTYFPSVPLATTGFGPYFAPSVSASNLTASQSLVCAGLVAAAASNAPAVELGFTATGLPAGDSIEVLDAAGLPLTITADGQIDWAPSLVEIGATYTTSIHTQPANATCTLGPSASGTATAENIVVEIDCAPAVSCPCFAAADLAATRALSGAICLRDDVGTVPVVDLYSGVYLQHPEGVWEIGGIGSVANPPALRCGLGCDDSGSTGQTSCSGLSRPDLFASLDLTQAEYDACSALVDVTCPPPSGFPCTLEVSNGAGVWPATLSTGGECAFMRNGTDIEGLILIDAPIPAGFDVESVASWADFVAGGGSVFAVISFDATAVQTGTGSVTDLSFLAGAGLDTYEIQPTASTYALTAIDDVNKTFTMEVTASVQGGTDSWPPREDPASPGTDRIESDPAAGTATLRLQGDWSDF